MRRAVPSFLIPLLSLGWAGCVEVAGEDAIDSEVTVPAKGTAETFEIAEWNIEWFGSTANGPTNEALQLSNVRDVIAGADLDLWGLEEVVSVTQFNSLKSQLTGYDGFLASDPIVAGGSSYYSSSEQKVGILYKKSIISVQAARVILTGSDYDFAGRPPLEVEATATINGASTPFVFIVIHAKAMADSSSYQRRVNASNALKSYLDSTRASARVVVVGDINDDLDVSIYNSLTSPYQNFVSDTTRYATPTKVFSDTHQPTTAANAQAIDHHIVTNEVAPLYVAGSAEIFRVDQYISSYSSTTSDHFPTLTRYKLGGTTSPAKVILNEILANEPGSDPAGEFVELVNAGGTTADLSGWTVSDSAGVRHTFAAGTTLAAGKALVVYGGAIAIPGGFPAVAASTGTLALTNGGDSVILRNASSVQIDAYAYSSALSSNDGVSMNRNPDADPAGTFGLHSTLFGSTSSPGRRGNGAAF